MKYSNLGNVIKTLDGEPVTEKDGATPLTVANACAAALLVEKQNAPGQRQATAQEKIESYELAKKLHGASDASLSAKQITTILDAVATAYTALIVGQVNEAFEAPDATEPAG